MVKLQMTILAMVLINTWQTSSAWLDQAASATNGAISGTSSQQGGHQEGGHAYSYVHFSGPVVGPSHPVIVEKKVVPHAHAVHGAHGSHHAAHHVAVPAQPHHSAQVVPAHHTTHIIPVHETTAHHAPHAVQHVPVPVHHSAHHVVVPAQHAVHGAAVSAQHVVKPTHTAHHTVHHVAPVVHPVVQVHKVAHHAVPVHHAAHHEVPVVHRVTHDGHHAVHPVSHGHHAVHPVSHGHHAVHPVSHGHHGAVLGHVAVAQPVGHGVHHATLAQAVGHAVHHTTQGTQAAHGVTIDYVAHPKYEFAYGVTDHKTGDNHNQKESRDGDVVVGEYSLQEPGGNVRTVKYVADKDGFHAHVINSNGNNHSGAHHGTQGTH